MQTHRRYGLAARFDRAGSLCLAVVLLDNSPAFLTLGKSCHNDIRVPLGTKGVPANEYGPVVPEARDFAFFSHRDPALKRWAIVSGKKHNTYSRDCSISAT